MFTLSDEAFVMLDPAVEMLGVEVAEHRLLCHGHFEVGLAVPPGEGLSDFVTALAGKPVRVGALREGFDDQHLIDTLLAALRQHGFLHLTSQAAPSDDELAQLRRTAEHIRPTTLRRTVALDLDAASADDVRARVEAEAAAPELRLRCARLADHAAALAELARLRQAGRLRLHHATVWTADLTGGADVAPSLRRLGAAVIVDGVPWPAPEHPIAGLDTLAHAGVPVHALMAPGRSFLDAAARARALAWAGSVFLSGLCLTLDADALWPTAEATEADFDGVFEAARALENAFGDLRIVNLPGDEVLLGNATSSSSPAALSDTANRFRTAYLRWRLPLLKSAEADNIWSQTPEAEEKVVRPQEDLLPNHPELLRLGPGSIVVDVCGGVGRVARRLSPLVGDDGLVVSVEMLRCLTDRARRFACERGFTNLQFRTGLAQRIPLPDATADAAVNEWTGAIWELGLGPAMVAEMARVVRPGGRIAVTHRLVRLPLARLGQPWVQYDDIYAWMRSAFTRPDLTVVAERIWGHTVPSMAGDKVTAWRKQYVPRLVNPLDVTFAAEENSGPQADVYLTIIAERH
jgi:SAM-dependent methyltransferase